MSHSNFYNERKYCTYCQAYVAYLASPSQCYCAQCGESVRMMSPEDWETFNHERSKKPRVRSTPSKTRRAKKATQKATPQRTEQAAI